MTRERTRKRNSMVEGLSPAAQEFVFQGKKQELSAGSPRETVVSVEWIVLPQSQPRKYFDEQKMQQLIESVRRDGILQPLLVRPAEEGKYKLVAGERRYRAAQKVGLTEVPVTIREMTDEQAMQYSLLENLQREDLNPVEETEGILLLLALNLGCETSEVSSLLYRMKHALDKPDESGRNVMPKEMSLVEEVFDKLSGMTWESFVKNRLPVLNLPTDVLEVLRQGRLEYTKARAIAQVKDDSQRQHLLKETIAEGLSLSQIKEQVKALKTSSDSTNPPPRASEIRKRLSKLTKSGALEDPQTCQKVEKLLTQLEKLLG